MEVNGEMTGKLLFGNVGRGRKAVQGLMFQVHRFILFLALNQTLNLEL